jgi:hypothetical protein
MHNTWKLVAIQIVFFLSCTENRDTINTVQTIDSPESVHGRTVPVIEHALPGCYMMIIERDTAAMQIDINGKAVKGKLLYKNFEKDVNHGTLNGIIDNGILKGWYRFSSEGMISTREVSYKVIENGFIEGYGDVAQRNDSAMFKYPTTINYETNHPFRKSDCEFLKRNFKE